MITEMISNYPYKTSIVIVSISTRRIANVNTYGYRHIVNINAFKQTIQKE